MKKDPLYKSFGYAFQGIFNTIRTERNIKIHCVAAILVTIFGIWLQISKTEWMICFILFGLILALELVNTAVEATVICLQRNENRSQRRRRMPQPVQYWLQLFCGSHWYLDFYTEAIRSGWSVM